MDKKKVKIWVSLFFVLVLVVSCAPEPEFQPEFKGVVFAGSIPVVGQELTQVASTTIHTDATQSAYQIQLSWPINPPVFIGVPFGAPSAYQASHTGRDLQASEGTPIYASGSGQVVFTGWFPQTPEYQSPNKGHGNTIWILHGFLENGLPLYTVYAHLSSFSVKEGDWVNQGQQIGLSGSTGAGSGPHLHFAIRVGGGFQYEGIDTYSRSWSDGHWVNPDEWVGKPLDLR